MFPNFVAEEYLIRVFGYGNNSMSWYRVLDNDGAIDNLSSPLSDGCSASSWSKRESHQGIVVTMVSCCSFYSTRFLRIHKNTYEFWGCKKGVDSVTVAGNDLLEVTYYDNIGYNVYKKINFNLEFEF